MFKGILPSRQIPSGDFTIITNLVDDHAKENQYSQTQVAATKGRTGAKGFLEKKKKSDTKKANDPSPKQVPDALISPQEFDKLLVSCYHHFMSFNSTRSSSLSLV